MKDKLINCRKCGGDACYVIPFNDDGFSYSCMGCGFTTNTLMVKGSEYYKSQIEALPSLYVDLLFEDDKGLVWFPNTINIPGLGMVFVNGTSKEDWKWTAVGMRKVLDEEKHKFPIKDKPGEYHTSVVDMNKQKHFERGEFMEAMEHIGIFK